MAKARFNSYEEVVNYVKSLSIQELIEGYANLLWEAENSKFEPIKLTKAQFETYFRIIGYTSDGSVEFRGRKPKSNSPSSDTE